MAKHYPQITSIAVHPGVGKTEILKHTESSMAMCLLTAANFLLKSAAESVVTYALSYAQLKASSLPYLAFNLFHRNFKATIMFYTFASAPAPSGNSSQRNLKRPKVSRACNYCRQHRVRCDTESPCSRCVANNIECVMSSPGSRPPESPQVPQSDSLSSQETAVPSTRSASPSVVPSKPEGMDSTVGFMSKISAFCSAISQLSSDSVDDSPPPYPSPGGQLLLNASRGLATVLSRPQVLHLLDIYWARCHPLVPILNRARVDALCQTLWSTDDSELHSSPLIDGVVALCLNYLDISGLNRRLVGLCREQGDTSLAYFRRCVTATSQYAAFAEPSLERLQCYVLMTLYLLDAGEHQPAYNMIGLALRIAQALNLHHGLPDAEPDANLGRRVWWTILHLNFRCGRLLGRPIGVQLAETTCPLPSADEFVHHTRVVSLTGATLAVTEALSRHPSPPREDRITQIESRASALSAEAYRLLEWRDQQLRPAIRRPLHVDNRGALESLAWIHSAVDASPSQVLHSVLIELQYYDEIIGLHRPFVCFPNRNLIPQRSPKADAHATTALHHAMATVDLGYRVMSTTDVLYGRSEVYQWQWNALLTLIGFQMSYPLCEFAPSARRHAQLALELFSAADSRNMVAVRAAAVTRSLCAKVDSLVKILKSDDHRPASPNAEKHYDGELDASVAPCGISHPNSEALWSWTDVTNPDVWSAYSDGITGVLADFPNLPFGNDNFFSLP
ncbi:fungal-specific transcription factor domain-containing protein [Hypoxylon crocopeplum]|nr:fungal-specific transcription factor domain-containing protein [Hypoxylon crocopeplum]